MDGSTRTRVQVRRRPASAPLAGVLGVVLACAGPGASDDGGAVDFDSQVRTILAEKCIACHGPDAAEGGLRLTGRDEAAVVLESGRRAVVPGDPGESELLARVRSADPDVRMPPPDHGEPLSEGEADRIEAWIREGADWPEHWAYRQLARPDPPTVDGTAWVRNPIDAFVLAGLEKAGIAPSPEAGRETLIRRLYLDLLGRLPPLEAVDAFLADRSPGAYERLVDRVLASPHFGERWGRHWLDKARYADSDGYEKDNARPNAWRYRDWVIDAVNRDVPLDRFTIEQIAGDLIPGATGESVLATAFNRQTLTNTEGGVDREQFRVAAVMDRTETVAAVWLGLTASCARCHNHKYDAFSQEEYYRFYAFFDNTDETEATVARSAGELARHEEELREHGERLQASEDRLRSGLESAESDGRRIRWEESLRRVLEGPHPKESFHPLEGARATADAEAVRLVELDDPGAFRAEGANPDAAVYAVEGEIGGDGALSGCAIELLPDDAMTNGGPGRGEGNVVVNEVRLFVRPAPEGGWVPVPLASAEASFAQDGWAVEGAIDGNEKPGRDGTGWAIAPRLGEAHRAVFRAARPVALSGGGGLPVRVELSQQYGKRHTAGSFRMQVRLGGAPEPVAPDVAQAVMVGRSARTADQERRVTDCFAAADPALAPLLREVRSLRDTVPAFPGMNVRVVGERTKDRRVTQVLERGDFTATGDAVDAGGLACLPPLRARSPDGGADRLDLARWLVSGENPLPPRVLANHVWSHLFGEGIVATENDFGVRGERPTHPGLLDWLASDLVEGGWSRKRLIRRIVTSAAYRQVSDFRPEVAAVDPMNRMLWRQVPLRVEAEIVRDVALDAAGLLSPKIGGPSVFPPVADDVVALTYNSAFKWEVSEGEDRYRRGMYTFFKRTAPDPNLMVFDCPDANTSSITRTRSNTPTGALALLNNQVFFESAQALAARVLREGSGFPDDAARIAHAFRLCLARRPTPGESAILIDVLAASRRQFGSDPESAGMAVGRFRPDGAGAAEAAAWVATVRVILNLDEFINRT